MTKAKTVKPVVKAQASKGLKSLKPSIVMEPIPTTKVTRRSFKIDTGDAPVTKADLEALVAAFQSGSQLIELSPNAIERIVKATGPRAALSAEDAKQPAKEVLSPVAQESADLDGELAAMQSALSELTVRLKPVLPQYDEDDIGEVADDVGVPNHNMHESTRVAAIQQLRSKRREVQRMRGTLDYLLKYIAV